MNRALLKWTFSLMIPVAASGAAWLLTRRAPVAPAASEGHNHGGSSVAGVAQPVALSSSDARRIGVTFAVARRGDLPAEVRTVGQVTFDEGRVRTISAKIDGWIESLAVDQTGQLMKAGDELFTIYSPMLVSAQEELLLAKKLAADVGQGSPSAREGATTLTSSARRRLSYWDVPEATIAEIESTGVVRKSIGLRAPFTGYVVEKNVLAGQRIMAGEALYKVADLDVVWVEGDVFEQDLAAVRVGQPVSVELSALPGATFTGRIAYLYPTLNSETRTARVRVTLGNPRHILKPGMFATLRIRGASRASAVLVPRAAVLSTGERSLVFVRDSLGHLVPREVIAGAASATDIEILRGLTAGETVVASATFLVDAESNLGTALGGMGDMPGMDVTKPPQPLPRKER